MSATALDLQSFYPDALKITGVEETAQEIIIHMHAVSRECTCYKCGASLIKPEFDSKESTKPWTASSSRGRTKAFLCEYASE